MIGNYVVTAVFGVCVSVFGACAPVPESTPPMLPCEGTNLTVHGFDSAPGCDMTPPQVLSVTVEHPSPWSPEQAAAFVLECDRSGGTVTDDVGDAWVCTGIDY
jgi:hypothetical protein